MPLVRSFVGVHVDELGTALFCEDSLFRLLFFARDSFLDVLEHRVWAEIHIVDPIDLSVHVLRIVIIKDAARGRSDEFFLHGFSDTAHH